MNIEQAATTLKTGVEMLFSLKEHGVIAINRTPGGVIEVQVYDKEMFDSIPGEVISQHVKSDRFDYIRFNKFAYGVNFLRLPDKEELI